MTETKLLNFDVDHVSTDTVTVEQSEFGTTANGKRVHRYRLSNGHGMTVDLLTYGAIIQSIRVPDKNGQLDDVTLGFDTVSEYENFNNAYFGAVVGRVANRISRASFTLDGTLYQLDANEGSNHIHGGLIGWSKVVWQATVIEGGVRMSLVSPDGDQGYPGEVQINATYYLTDDCQLILRMTAVNRFKPTPINPTNHAYFNLAGAGSESMAGHLVSIFADYYLPNTEERVPTGVKAPVADTVFDLTQPTSLVDALSTFNSSFETFGNYFCLRGPDGKRLAARLEHPPSGRTLEVWTNQPGLVFYSGFALELDMKMGTKKGKDGRTYNRHSALCLETHNYPDAINQPSFPDSVLREGSTYDHIVWYKFSSK